MSHSKTSATVTPYPLYALVVLDDGYHHPLEYGVPPHLIHNLQVGTRVKVLLKNSPKLGTILSLSTTASFPSVKPLVEVLSERLLAEELIQLTLWIASYYCAPLGKVFKFLLPAAVKKEIQPKLQLWVQSLLSQEKLKELCTKLRTKKPAQAKVLDVLLQKPKGLLLSELLEASQTSQSPVDTLVKGNILYTSPLDHLSEEPEYFITSPKTLSPDQKVAYTNICASLDSMKFHPYLIHGVTGSGKTEVYLQAIAYARKLGYSALMLVPEIALTTQMIERFKSRFQEPIAIYHHRLSHGERYDLWHKIQRGDIRIVLGARSAVFLPLRDLKLLIVDEEHETSYKQNEESPCYHGRDVAVMRAKLCSATLLLGSATPSLESYTNAKTGKYTLISLPSRAGTAFMPKIHLLNMGLEKNKAQSFSLFAPSLLEAIDSRINLGEQSLLFLNRRGYHSLLLCPSCQEPQKCPHCDVSLTFHKKINSLQCHTCGYSLCPPPQHCPGCKSSSLLVYKGIGTELVETSLKRIFPHIRTLRMDADTTKHKGSHQELFKQFRGGKADVLIGTQMIAKGFHFPSVTLVGVLNSDGALHTGDFRAAEHLFQLLVQVAGRAGRAELPGEVFIQTFMPHHKLFSFLSQEDYLGFYQEEIASRKLFDYPPFTHLAKLTFTGSCPN
ncbi:MAG: primosomal protein N', partial [Chlamydiae bacterium]|nr:primosomal protein N' [Chlamydiota bacterium]